MTTENTNQNDNTKDTTQNSVTMTKADHDALMSRLTSLESKFKEEPDKDKSLLDKVRADENDQEKKTKDSKALEAAITFNLKAPEWLKNNAALLPKEIEGIFKAADAEKYEDAIKKDSAIKADLVQSFFGLQANLDLLTSHQKNMLDDYLKLSKNGRNEKAQDMYDMVFEPAFEMLKRIKKAEALNKGHNTETDVQSSYKNKLLEISTKHYMRGK
jgi:hypothetical protein